LRVIKSKQFVIIIKYINPDKNINKIVEYKERSLFKDEKQIIRKIPDTPIDFKLLQSINFDFMPTACVVDERYTSAELMIFFKKSIW